MEVLLRHHQSVIHLLRTGDPTTNLKELLDKIVSFLNNTNTNQDDGYHVLTLICHDLSRFSSFKCFNNLQIMTHQFFVMLSRTFRMFLTKLTFASLTKQDEECFNAIRILIHNLCSNNNRISTCFYTDNNERLNPKNEEKFNLVSYEKIFFTEIFIQKFVGLISNDVVVNDYEPYHIKYKLIDSLLRLFMKLNDFKNNLILDSVIQCIQSELYLHVYENINLGEPMLNPKQSLFLYQCPKYIRRCSYHREKEISYSLCRSVLEYSVDIFDKHFPVVLHNEGDGAKIQAVAWYIEFINHFALTPATREFFYRRLDSQKTMVDEMIHILKTEPLVKSVQENHEVYHADVALMSYSITLLYNLTFEKKIFYHLKSRDVIEICEKLYTAKDRTIQFASRTLGAILNQEDIDEINRPDKVAQSYLYFIESTIDELTLTFHGIKLDGVLTNLETIVQNDQIKEEITNDDEGIPLLARCAYESYLDVETIQRPALRIIEALSFANDTAVKQIRENDNLMNHIIGLITRNDKYQLSTAKRIQWKVEKEPDFILNQKNYKKQKKISHEIVFDEKKAIYQYVTGDHRFKLNKNEIADKFHIMLSYCQDDKEFCQKIYNRLTASDSYRVSADTDGIYTFRPEAMAEALGKSAIVIICFSTKYRNSYLCRLEAECAEKLNRSIIPIKIEPQYHLSGWLSDFIQEGDCIDFTQSDFNTAYAQLKNRIDEEYEQIDES